MTTEHAFGIALGLTWTACCLVFLLFRRPLRGLSRNEDQACFWTSSAAIVIVLIPTIALLMARPDKGDVPSVLFAVVDLLKWALLGLFLAVFLVIGSVVSALESRSASIRVTRSDVDDLQRLLDKVHEIRASQILRRVPEEERPSA